MNMHAEIHFTEVENNPEYWEEMVIMDPQNLHRDRPQPLFITEDGVEIFEGDTYYITRGIGVWNAQAKVGSGRDTRKNIFLLKIKQLSGLKITCLDSALKIYAKQ